MIGLPTGELELLMKAKGRGRHKEEWKSVAFTDYLLPEEIADCVERWSGKYKVVAARYNGRKVSIPAKYHWEHRFKDELYGTYKTRKEVSEAMQKRREYNWGLKNEADRIPIGTPKFVAEK